MLRVCQRFLCTMLLLFSPYCLAEPYVVGTYYATPTIRIYEQLVREGYGRLNQPIQLRPMPVVRGIQELARGNLDANLLHLSPLGRHYTSIEDIPVALPAMEVLVVTLNSYPHDHLVETESPFRIGVFLRFPELAELLPNSTFIGVQGDYSQMLALLRRQRIDLALMSEWDARPLLEQESDLKVLRNPRFHFQVYHTVHTRHRHLIEPLAQSFNHLQQEGRAAAIVQGIVQQTAANISRKRPSPFPTGGPPARAKTRQLGS